jgi:3-phenylpropionate/trans-cinnamate dioxygenase ferredoxin component
MTAQLRWLEVCAVDDLEEGDLREFVDGGRIYVVYRTASGFYASSGLCTHEGARLADGVVLGDLIECPRHQGQFHILTGEARRAPARRKLRTYPARAEGGRLYIGLPARAE